MSTPDPSRTPAGYREEAERCEQLAEFASSRNRARLLNLAARWRAYAGQDEQKTNAQQ